MNRSIAWVFLVAAACEPMPTSGELFTPVATKAAAGGEEASDPPAEDESATPEGFDFEAADRVGEASDRQPPLTESEMLSGLGLQHPSDAVAAVAEPQLGGVELPESALGAAGGLWGTEGAVTSGWGLRLVSTVVDAQPPRAILGLPDGTEAVVKPGTLLPEIGIVVLAVGRDSVQVAEVIPDGDHARVQTRTLSSLFPGAR